MSIFSQAAYNLTNNRFNAYLEAKKDFYDDLSVHGAEFLDFAFRELFKRFEGLTAVAILGWTPGFNDGDPCYHSSATFAGVATRWGIDYEQYGSNVSSFFEELTPEDADTPNDALTVADREKVVEELQRLEEVVRYLRETDFFVTVHRNDDGDVVINIEHYSCDY